MHVAHQFWAVSWLAGHWCCRVYCMVAQQQRKVLLSCNCTARREHCMPANASPLVSYWLTSFSLYLASRIFKSIKPCVACCLLGCLFQILYNCKKRWEFGKLFYPLAATPTTRPWSPVQLSLVFVFKMTDCFNWRDREERTNQIIIISVIILIFYDVVKFVVVQLSNEEFIHYLFYSCYGLNLILCGGASALGA